MPHYYFDIHDGVEVIDKIGQELPDDGVAKGEAYRIAANVAGTTKALADNGCALTVVVRSSPDTTIMTIRLVFNVDQPWKQRQRVPVTLVAES